MAAASIVSGNVWECFHECWHERFNGCIYVLSILCRYTNRNSIKLRTIRFYRLAI